MVFWFCLPHCMGLKNGISCSGFIRGMDQSTAQGFVCIVYTALFTSVLNACRQLSFVLLEDKLYNMPFVTKQGRQLFLRLGLELIW